MRARDSGIFAPRRITASMGVRTTVVPYARTYAATDQAVFDLIAAGLTVWCLQEFYEVHVTDL
jgi:hypothetical protein